MFIIRKYTVLISCIDIYIKTQCKNEKKILIFRYLNKKGKMYTVIYVQEKNIVSQDFCIKIFVSNSCICCHKKACCALYMGYNFFISFSYLKYSAHYRRVSIIREWTPYVFPPLKNNSRGRELEIQFISKFFIHAATGFFKVLFNYWPSALWMVSKNKK